MVDRFSSKDIMWEIDNGDITTTADGEWVRHSDYAALEAENARLKHNYDESKRSYERQTQRYQNIMRDARTEANAAVKVARSRDGETLAEEFDRLVCEYRNPGTDGTQAEAWNLIADFAVENADAILSALSPSAQQEDAQAIPRAKNVGRYLAEVNDGRLLYLNHANTWQECHNFISHPPAPVITEELIERASAEYMKIFGKHLLSSHARQILTATLQAIEVKP